VNGAPIVPDGQWLSRDQKCDVIGDGCDAVVKAPDQIAKSSADSRFREQPHADFVGDEKCFSDLHRE